MIVIGAEEVFDNGWQCRYRLERLRNGRWLYTVRDWIGEAFQPFIADIVSDGEAAMLADELRRSERCHVWEERR